MKRSSIKILLLNFSLLIISSSASAQVQSRAFKLVLDNMLSRSVPIITVQEVREEENLILLDTRAKKEFDVSHLKYAQWIGYDEFSLDKVKKLPKNAPIVVYCSIGVRSEQIGEKLKKAGFTNVRNMYGSIFEWVNQGNPVYDNKGKETKKVHAYDRTWGLWCTGGEKVY